PATARRRRRRIRARPGTGFAKRDSSMANKMLIDATHPEETRVVVVRGNRVERFDFESASRRQLRGNIYLAKVTRVQPAVQAAVREYGGNRHGFLAFSEIHPDYYQIPVADRQALIAEEERAHREAEDEVDRRAGRGRGRGADRRRDRRRSQPVGEDGVPAAEAEAESAAGDETAVHEAGEHVEASHEGTAASAEGPEASAAEAGPGAADADAASHEPVLVVREAVEEQAAAEAAEHAAHDADAHAHHDAVDHDHDTHGETADAHQQFVPAEAHVADEVHDDQHG